MRSIVKYFTCMPKNFGSGVHFEADTISFQFKWNGSEVLAFSASIYNVHVISGTVSWLREIYTR